MRIAPDWPILPHRHKKNSHFSVFLQRSDRLETVGRLRVCVESNYSTKVDSLKSLAC